jgi:hypothetical protein
MKNPGDNTYKSHRYLIYIIIFSLVFIILLGVFLFSFWRVNEINTYSGSKSNTKSTVSQNLQTTIETQSMTLFDSATCDLVSDCPKISCLIAVKCQDNRCKYEPVLKGKSDGFLCNTPSNNNELSGVCNGLGICIKKGNCKINTDCGPEEKIGRSECNKDNNLIGICSIYKIPNCEIISGKDYGTCKYDFRQKCLTTCNSKDSLSNWKSCNGCMDYFDPEGNAACVPSEELVDQKCLISDSPLSTGKCNMQGKCIIT